MQHQEKLDWIMLAFYRCLIREAELDPERRRREQKRRRAEKFRETAAAFWKQQRQIREQRVAADWAKVTDDVVNRMLRASKLVGPKATFEELAVEFTIPNASTGRKTNLKNKLTRIVRKHSGHGKNDAAYVCELRSALKH
ncbi:MAG TPA: hypothetical protein VHV29_06860 [Terriglobales bacterium]|jgi:hypothetical protein|nr:hypothetical protein [Terriglobales bacterium]